MKRILVIKLGALGDFVQAFWALQRIRDAHPEAHIALLTTPPYRELAETSGLFDAIETDGRPKGLRAHLRLFARLRAAGYDRVYDLHTSSRTRRYLQVLWPHPPEWSGHAPGASHRQKRPDRDALHNLDRLADQLHVAGIAPSYALGAAPAPDLSWAVRAARGESASMHARFALRPPFALLAPGASPSRPEKLWPVRNYAELAANLARRGLQPVIMGSPAEAPLARAILQRAPTAVDLTGRTRMIDLAGLGAEAAFCVGNDTGPTHMAGYAGAPGLMLMSPISRTGHCEPRARMGSLKIPDLADLTVEAVLARLEADRLLSPEPPKPTD